MRPHDIKFYHSGGPGNSDPNADLGGAVSSSELSSTALNNLFNTVTRKTVAENDYVDYRCFYIFNRSADTLFDARIFIDSEKKNGSYIDIGVPVQNEEQVLIFTGKPWEGDTITLDIDANTVEIDYYLNVTEWQGDIQTKIRGLENLQDVIVESAGAVPNVTFTVKFVGSACCRDYSLISQVSSGLHDTTFSVTLIQDGSPIETTAETIPTKLHRPTGIQFSYPLEGNPVLLGNLRPNEGFPVWVRRSTPKGTIAKIVDNFVLKVDGSAS